MKVTVTLLRKAGRKLKRSELEPPVQGRLVLGDWPTPNVFKRWVRKAEVLGAPYGGMEANAVAPLFDAQVIRIDESGIVLQGVEVHIDGDAIHEHVQIWICQPVTTT